MNIYYVNLGQDWDKYNGHNPHAYKTLNAAKAACFNHCEASESECEVHCYPNKNADGDMVCQISIDKVERGQEISYVYSIEELELEG